MIEVASALEEGVFAVRFRGAVTNREFIDLAATIANFGSTGRILVYLDWVGIDRWAFSVPTAGGETAWRRARNVIARAALPFFWLLVVRIGLITVWPELVTWLPDVVMGREK